jgi:L-iditol 2-dehydrogenase
MDRLGHRSGLPIAIFGAGPIGVIMTALAEMAGLGPIVVMEPRAGRRALAERFGASATFDPTAPGFTGEILEHTKGVGFPYVVDAVGHPTVVEQAISVAARAGNILLLGVAAPSATATIRPNEIYAKELSLLGTALNPYTHRRAANLIPRLGLDRLNAGFFPLDQHEAAFKAQVEGTYDKVFIKPQEQTGAFE